MGRIGKYECAIILIQKSAESTTDFMHAEACEIMV